MTRIRPLLAILLLIAVATLLPTVLDLPEPLARRPARPSPDTEPPRAPPADGASHEEPEVPRTGIPVLIRIVDERGRSVPSATVEIRHRDRLIDSGVMGHFGILSFRDIPPGYYTEITASAPGFVPARARLDDLDPRDAVFRLRRGIPFRGVVLAHECRRPVAGARVGIYEYGMGHLRTETGEDGTFSVPAVPPHRLIDVSVEAGRDGWTAIHEIVAAPGVPLEIVLPEVRSLTGRIVDEAGRGVPGVRVESEVGHGKVSIHGICADGSRRDGTPGVTNAEGRFILEGLVRDYCGLIVVSEEWKRPERRVCWYPGDPEPELTVVPRTTPEVARKSEQGSGRILGRIVTGTTPVIAEVHARREIKIGERSEFMDWNTVWCRPDGSFEIAGLAEAFYAFSVEALGHEELHVADVEATAEGTDLGVLRPVALVLRSGTVVDENGTPLPSASVNKRPVRPDGTFTVEVPTDCDHWLDAWAPGYVSRRLKNPAEGVVIALSPVHIVEGTVVDVNGKPIPSVRLYAAPAAPRVTKTDLAGRFRLTYAKAGEYSVLPSIEGHEFAGHPSFRTGDRKVVIRAVLPTFVAGRVLDDTGMPIEEAAVRIGKAKALTGPDGRFRLEHLLGHTFRVRVVLDDPDLAVCPVDGVRPKTEDLVLRAERGGRISGRVVFPDGRPAPGFPVWAEAVGHDAPDRDADTDRDGRFELRGLLPGEWRLGGDWSGDDDEDGWWEVERSGFRPGDRGVVLRLLWIEDEEADDDEKE